MGVNIGNESAVPGSNIYFSETPNTNYGLDDLAPRTTSRPVVPVGS